jgi:hypothetical protein
MEIMSTLPTIESRLESLEREMAELRERLNRTTRGSNWLERIVGSQSRDADFEEVLRLGREARSADRSADNGGA